MATANRNGETATEWWKPDTSAMSGLTAQLVKCGTAAAANEEMMTPVTTIHPIAHAACCSTRL